MHPETKRTGLEADSSAEDTTEFRTDGPLPVAPVTLAYGEVVTWHEFACAGTRIIDDGCLYDAQMRTTIDPETELALLSFGHVLSDADVAQLIDE